CPVSGKPSQPPWMKTKEEVTQDNITKVLQFFHTAPPKETLSQCYFCCFPGHGVKFCPFIPLEWRNHCIRCWDPDHSSRDCPVSGKPSQPPWMNTKEEDL
ncbi:9299_t:CDS:2, partial [Gigaspora rosea]